MKYFLTIDKKALKGVSEHTESTISTKMKLYMEAAQVVPDKLKQEILSVLNLFDRSNKLNESANMKFWEKFLNEKHANTMEINYWLIFLQIAVGSSYVRYANRFPVFFNLFREGLMYASDCMPASLSSPPKSQDIRSILLQGKSMVEKDGNLDKSSNILISDNLLEILAYFLFLSDKMEDGYCIDMTKAMGLNGDRSIKNFIKKIKHLRLEIKQHVERKINVLKSLENNSFYKFWHKECAKRKFYLEYVDNANKLSEHIDFILTYIIKTSPKHKFYCKNCIFNKTRNINELVVSSLYFKHCYNKNCTIKKRAFEFHEAKDLQKKYGYYLPDLISPISAGEILQHEKKYQTLPLDEVVESMQAYALMKNDMDKYIPSESLVSFFSKVESFTKREKTQTGKIHIDNESFMIGIHIWDQIFIHGNKGYLRNIIKGLEDCELGEILSEKYPNYNKKPEQATEREFTIDVEVYLYCYDCFEMIKQSINNFDAKLLSKSASKKQRKERGKK